MRNKLYFIASSEDIGAISATLSADKATFHYYSIMPEHKSYLCVVMKPKHVTKQALTDKYVTFPDINDQRATLTPTLIAAFPVSVGLTIEDNTYSALNKIHTALGMAAMHPLA